MVFFPNADDYLSDDLSRWGRHLLHPTSDQYYTDGHDYADDDQDFTSNISGQANFVSAYLHERSNLTPWYQEPSDTFDCTLPLLYANSLGYQVNLDQASILTTFGNDLAHSTPSGSLQDVANSNIGPPAVPYSIVLNTYPHFLWILPRLLTHFPPHSCLCAISLKYTTSDRMVVVVSFTYYSYQVYISYI